MVTKICPVCLKEFDSHVSGRIKLGERRVNAVTCSHACARAYARHYGKYQKEMNNENLKHS